MTPMRTVTLTLAVAAVGLTAALAFGAGFAIGASTPEKQKPRIEVRADTVAAQVVNRAAMIGRDLTEAEIVDIVDRQIGIEVLIRKAAKLDVHLKDADIRKHMVAVMTHVLSGQVPEPTHDDLAAFLAENPDRYMTPNRVSFEHVFFAEDHSAAEALAQSLRDGGEAPAGAGDIFWLGRDMDSYSSSQLLTVLGHGFVQAVSDIPMNTWTGPIRSGRGWHVVRLKARHAPQPLPAEERDRRLREDWQRHRLSLGFAEKVEAMRAGYDISSPDPETLRAAIAGQASRSRSIWAVNATAPVARE